MLTTPHAQQRLAIEAKLEALAAKKARLPRWLSRRVLIPTVLRLTGTHGRGHRNALNIDLVQHPVELSHLPATFSGLRILHLSDLHIDLSPQMADAIVERVTGVDCDLCVLTGDYRFRSSGDIDQTLHGLARLLERVSAPTYAVLGNHDSMRMVPQLTKMDVHVLMNEHVNVTRGEDSIYLAGIDDMHVFKLGDVAKALHDVPQEAVSILLSHTPEVYAEAALAKVDFMLSGHTHGGQICLPGGYPVILDARLPRRMGRGRWRHEQMLGYTSPGAGASLVGARFNCPPEITLHTLNLPK